MTPNAARLFGPDMLADDDPSLVGSAVEEALRYDSPVQFTSRVLKADLALGGKQLRAGELLLALLGAANHDPEHWHSVWGRTSVWERRWPGWRAGSCSKNCSAGCPTCGWRGRRRSTATTLTCAA
jgi:hypothetical protein